MIAHVALRSLLQGLIIPRIVGAVAQALRRPPSAAPGFRAPRHQTAAISQRSPGLRREIGNQLGMRRDLARLVSSSRIRFKIKELRAGRSRNARTCRRLPGCRPAARSSLPPHIPSGRVRRAFLPCMTGRQIFAIGPLAGLRQYRCLPSAASVGLISSVETGWLINCGAMPLPAIISGTRDRAFEEVHLEPKAALAEHVAVVGGEDDDRVVQHARRTATPRGFRRPCHRYRRCWRDSLAAPAAPVPA